MKIMKKLSVFFLLMLLACSPKIQEQTSMEETVKDDMGSPPPPLTPCTTFTQLGDDIREITENAFVLYREALKRENYEEAIKQWKIAYYNAPGSNGVVKSHFSDGVALYSRLLKMISKSKEDSVDEDSGKQADTTRGIILDEKQKAYLDTIMQIFDKRVECFGEDAAFYAQKGFDLYYNLFDYVNEIEIYYTFKKSIDLSGEIPEYYVVNPFVKLLYDLAITNRIDHKEAAYYALKMDTAIKKSLATCKGKECEPWEIINSYAPDRIEALEAIDGFYDCDYYTEKYYKLHQENPEDCEFVKLAYARMIRGGCPPDHQPLKELQGLFASQCYEAPASQGPCREGVQAYHSGKYRDAVTLLQECADSAETNEKRAEYLLMISKIYYRDLKNFPQSRKYALEAAKLKKNWGEPFILIGKLYASSGPICGPGTGFESQVVTWPAIDKFVYAKSIDPSVSEEADRLIASYSKYMPSKEDIFFRRIPAGSSYFVGCWIQEKTTVRTSD